MTRRRGATTRRDATTGRDATTRCDDAARRDDATRRRDETIATPTSTRRDATRDVLRRDETQGDTARDATRATIREETPRDATPDSILIHNFPQKSILAQIPTPVRSFFSLKYLSILKFGCRLKYRPPQTLESTPIHFLFRNRSIRIQISTPIETPPIQNQTPFSLLIFLQTIHPSSQSDADSRPAYPDTRINPNS